MDGLDDKDEFTPKGSCDERNAALDAGINRTPPPYGKVPPEVQKHYPFVVPNTLRYWIASSKDTRKAEVQIKCTVPGCDRTNWVFVSDLFQVKKCCEHRQEDRMHKRAERAEKMRVRQELMGLESVSNLPVTEELGGIRPAHLLIKAKHDFSWIEYTDAEGNTKFMQVHDVRSARDAHGRWAVYGVDQDGQPVHELYDLRHGYEHSGAFSGIRELAYGEIVKLVQQGVIKGQGGKPIKTLAGLMQIADEALRKLIMKKMKEAKLGGPSLEAIEKQMFAEPAASSAQKRRTGKTGTRPWQSTSMSL